MCKGDVRVRGNMGRQRERGSEKMEDEKGKDE